MTREEAKAEILKAGGQPSDSAWIKFGIPERSPIYSHFLSRHYSEMHAGEAMAEVTSIRIRARLPNPLTGCKV